MFNTNSDIISESTTTAGLESIALVALQALQRNQGGRKTTSESHKTMSTESSSTLTSSNSNIDSNIEINSNSNSKSDITINNNITSTTSTSTLATLAASSPPPLPAMAMTARVVSVDNIGKDHNGSYPSYQASKVQGQNIATTISSNSGTFLKAPDISIVPDSSVGVGAGVGAGAGTSKKDIPSSSPSLLNDNAVIATPTPDIANFSRILADPEAWLRQTENMFAQLPAIEKLACDNGKSNEIVVQPSDVLCGRGGETNHHPGNVQYRSLVKAYQKLYLLAKRRDKPKIAQCIVVSVRGVGGRFLKRTKKCAQLDPTTTRKSPSWIDVGHVKAREKTSQALREGAPDLRETVTTAKNNAAVTTTISNSSAGVKKTQAQIEGPHQGKHAVVPLSVPTAFEAMMELRMNYNHTADTSKNVTTSTSSSSPSISYNNHHMSHSHGASPSPSLSDPLLSSSSNVDKDVLTAKAFTTAAAKLMHHPIFHQLTPSQQQEAILHELNAARASAAVVTTKSRTSLVPSPPLMSKLPPYPYHHHQQQPQRYPSMPPMNMPPMNMTPHEHSYYQRDHYGHYLHAGNRNNSSEIGAATATTNITTSNTSTIPSPLDYREVLIAKAAAVTSSGSSNNDELKSSTDGSILNVKKRPASSISATVVSDTGSELSSISSSSTTNSNCDLVPSTTSSKSTNDSHNNSNMNENNNEAIVDGGTPKRGSRLKRFKLRMKDTIN